MEFSNEIINLDEFMYNTQMVDFECYKDLVYIDMQEASRMMSSSNYVLSEGVAYDTWDKILTFFEKIWHFVSNIWHKLVKAIKSFFNKSFDSQVKKAKDSKEYADKLKAVSTMDNSKLADALNIKTQLDSLYKSADNLSSTGDPAMVIKSLLKAEKAAVYYYNYDWVSKLCKDNLASLTQFGENYKNAVEDILTGKAEKVTRGDREYFITKIYNPQAAFINELGADIKAINNEDKFYGAIAAYIRVVANDILTGREPDSFQVEKDSDFFEEKFNNLFKSIQKFIREARNQEGSDNAEFVLTRRVVGAMKNEHLYSLRALEYTAQKNAFLVNQAVKATEKV